MAAPNCPPKWFGDDCDLLICARGKLDFSTKQCICPDHFAPPFCNQCMPGYWGASCSNVPLEPIRENTMLFSIIVPALPFLASIIVLLVCITLYYSFIDFRSKCCKRSAPSIRQPSLRTHRVLYLPPPPYSEVQFDLPPPYQEHKSVTVV